MPPASPLAWVGNRRHMSPNLTFLRVRLGKIDTTLSCVVGMSIAIAGKGPGGFPAISAIRIIFSQISPQANLKMRGSVAFASWLFAASLSLAAPDPGFETVETENGRIVGHRSAINEDVWEYLGIPYAQSPLGDLRFAAPQKYKGNGSYTASKFVSACFNAFPIESID
jgi:hypothetical protein